MCILEKGEGREIYLPVTKLFVGHLKGTELLRQHKEASSKANQSRTPLHPVQQKSIINATPTNTIIMNRTSLRQPSTAHRSAPTTLIPPAVTDRLGEDGSVSTALVPSTRTGCSKETCPASEGHNCGSESRKLVINREDAAASISNHSKKHLYGQKQSIEQSPQSSPTMSRDHMIITKGSSTTPLRASAVTMTTEMTEKLERNSGKEGSAEVTPEHLITLSSGSTTKRRLKLEEGRSCKPQTKRRRMSKRDSSGSSGKKSVAKSGCSLKKYNSGQRTMQSYFQPA